MDKQTEKVVSPSLQTGVKKEIEEDYIFNEKDLRYYWLEFANLLPVENAANAGRMKTMTPHLINDTTFEFVVDNEFVEKNMTDMIPQIQEHLRKQLHNSKITMTVRISKPQEVIKAYNKVEQYQMMSKKNPNLKRLCEELDLELS